jgi:hypothetical protein
MRTAVCVFVASAMLLGPEVAQTNTRVETVPKQVLAARKIYVENRTGNVELQDQTYLQLAKWGRLTLVDSPKKADVVLRLNGSDTVTFVPTGEKTYLYNSSMGGKWQDAEEQVPGGFTRLALIDPKTGATLWNEQRKTIGPEAKSRILDGLREAIELGEKRYASK